MVFYLAILPTIFDISAITVTDSAILAGVTVMVIASTDLIWIGLATRARAFLKTPRAQRIVNRVGAATMGGAARDLAARSA